MHCHLIKILPTFVFLNVNDPATSGTGNKRTMTTGTFGIQGTKTGVTEIK